MKSVIGTAALVAATAFVAIGCGNDETTDSENAGIDGSAYLLKEEPKGGIDVINARETVKDDDEVVVVGRIGGSKNPWVKDRAAFSIVDSSLLACSDNPEDNCPTPWDYCCADNLAQSKVLVKFVDDEGKLVKADAKKLLDLKELQTVVVKGKAERDKAGNLRILATGIYVRQ